ncbi:MAG: SPOR domain-containing protein [Desulfobacterales bacterium]|nr:SPOR domain-containing protein [Desulfobacterales bacterium]
MVKKEKASPEKKKSPPSPPRKGLAVWIGLTLFACGWMFVLGILVGRETVPVKFNMEKLQNELAALKEAVVKKELDQYKIDSNADIDKTKMGFYETLKKNGSDEGLEADIPEQKSKPLAEEKTESGTEKTSPPKKVESETRKISPPKKDESETKKTSPPKKLATPQKKKTVNLKKTAEGNENFTIQIASLKDSAAADKMVAKLKKRGYPAYRSIGKIPDKGIWYRVRVGYFKNRAEARGTIQRLKNEKIEAIIVQR